MTAVGTAGVRYQSSFSRISYPAIKLGEVLPTFALKRRPQFLQLPGLHQVLSYLFEVF